MNIFQREYTKGYCESAVIWFGGISKSSSFCFSFSIRPKRKMYDFENGHNDGRPNTYNNENYNNPIRYPYCFRVDLLNVVVWWHNRK